MIAIFDGASLRQTPAHGVYAAKLSLTHERPFGQSGTATEWAGNMARRALFPAGTQKTADQIKLSPGIVSGNHVFVTGMTGCSPDGSLPENLEDQFRQAFEKINTVLREAGLDFSAVVEMTTYHIGLRDHFDRFCAVRSEYVSDPFPTWTAVEVAGLRREGAVVEIRVIAAIEVSLPTGS